jgi:hypothetical protein
MDEPADPSSRFHPPQQCQDPLLFEMMYLSELTTISTGLSGRYSRASPVTHAIPSSFGVDSAAARAALGFKSIPVNSTAMPRLRDQAEICCSRFQPLQPTSTMCTGPPNPGGSRFSQARSRLISRQPAVDPLQAALTATKILIATVAIHPLR